MGVLVAVRDVGLPPPGSTLRESVEWAESVGHGIVAPTPRKPRHLSILEGGRDRVAVICYT